MDILEKIKNHLDNKKYCKIKRQINQKAIENAKGYIVDYSDRFILIQETDDFNIDGFSIISIDTIIDIPYSNKDKYYDKIMNCEGLVDKVQKKHTIDLTSWSSVFKTIRKYGFNVIVENENPDDESFDIGPITRISDSSVHIRYFDAQGFLNEKATKISWDLITIVRFDTHYINTFSKYLRERKTKKI